MAAKSGKRGNNGRKKTKKERLPFEESFGLLSNKHIIILFIAVLCNVFFATTIYKSKIGNSVAVNFNQQQEKFDQENSEKIKNLEKVEKFKNPVQSEKVESSKKLENSTKYEESQKLENSKSGQNPGKLEKSGKDSKPLENIQNHEIFQNSYECNEESLNEFAKDSMRRAKTPECKQKIKEIACQNDLLYPKQMKSTCDFYQKSKYLGCYEDYKRKGEFSGNLFVRYPDYNDPYECAKFCYKKKFNYAGMQKGFGCCCMNDISTYKKLSEDKCDIPCPLDFDFKCGGDSTISVYEVTHYFSCCKRAHFEISYGLRVRSIS